MNKKKIQNDFFKKIDGFDIIQAAFNSFPDTYIFVKDLKGRHIFMNDRLAKLRGFNSSEDAIGSTSYDYSPREIADQYIADDQMVFKTGKPVISRQEKIYMGNNKSRWFATTKVPLYDKNKKIIGLSGVSRDISKLRSLLNRVTSQKNKLDALSKIDPLTGAFNRRFLNSEFSSQYESNKRKNKGCALLVFDLDNFKSVNDTFGHTAGDRVLVEFSRSVNKIIKRTTDIFIRFGGDEFLLCLLGADAEFANAMALKIQNNMRHIKWPKKIFKKDFVLSSSIGIASIKKNEALGNLLKRSDQAVYAAKTKGGNCIVNFATGNKVQ